MQSPACFSLPRLLVPRAHVDPSRYAVIACDQFTAEPDYWARVRRTVGDAPSCLHLTLPELWLSDDDAPRIRAIHENMHRYLAHHLRELPAGLLLTERDCGRGCPRRGVLLAFDLEGYSEQPGAKTPIRPTEATVTERVPARLAIRADAPFELPHLLFFVDDPDRALLEPLFDAAAAVPPLYDFSLMEGGGRLTARLLPPEGAAAAFLTRLAARCTADAPVFATGDGNHSMAAAKAHWERRKRTLSPAEQQAHPARFVLAELVNLWDESICFEPVHRLLLDVDPADALAFLRAQSAAAAERHISIAYHGGGAHGTLALGGAADALPAALLQDALDAFLAARPDARIDFIHGADTLQALAAEPRRLGFVLPDFPKDALYPYVSAHGPLPRKTFSMGTAREKRYYLEGRRIR